MRTSFSALRLTRPGCSSSSRSHGVAGLQNHSNRIGCPQPSHCFGYHRFSTHSFVLDPELHGKIALQSSKPGARLCPSNLYSHLVESKQIDSDPVQLQALDTLESFHNAVLQGGRPPRRSLYIYGPAGAGKSMVMDIFHFCLEQNGIRTRRQHFHEFLYEMHKKLHQLHLKQRNVSTHTFIRQISEDIGRELDVLCFDEFAITSIQDCTLLVPLFSQLFTTGICLVTTSNRHPDDLYEDGLNRHLYLPEFLRILHENAELARVESNDYRKREFIKDLSTDSITKLFFGVGEVEADTLLQKLGPWTNTLEITIGYGRKMLIHSCTEDEKSVLFDARKLFGGPPFFGADDYNAICGRFDTIVLNGLWVLDMADHNEAKRITNFLDCAYELHVRVVCVNMEDVAVEGLFSNLLPLETLSLKELLSADKHAKTAAPGEMPEIVDVTALAQEGSADGSLQQTTQLLQSINDLPIASSQQSCYFLSADHKDWSVESKIVQTSSRKQTMGVTLNRQSAADRANVAIDYSSESGTPRNNESLDLRQASSTSNGLLSKIENVLPKEPDQSGRSKHFADEASSTSFDDPTSEQHSVKGVFVAAVASLHETGFAVKRAVSRLHEMQTTKYLEAHRAKRAF